MTDLTHIQDSREKDGQGLCGDQGTTMSEHEVKRGRITCGECLEEFGRRKRDREERQCRANG